MFSPKAVRETGQFSLLYSVAGLLSVQELSTHSPIKNIYLFIWEIHKAINMLRLFSDQRSSAWCLMMIMSFYIFIWCLILLHSQKTDSIKALDGLNEVLSSESCVHQVFMYFLTFVSFFPPFLSHQGGEGDKEKLK